MIRALLFSVGLVAAWFDFDEVMMIAMGFAGLAYVIVDQKRERELERTAREFEQRITRLESATAGDNPIDLLRDMGGRVDDLVDRVSRVEARIDYQPVRQTKRRADGKFAKGTE